MGGVASPRFGFEQVAAQLAKVSELEAQMQSSDAAQASSQASAPPLLAGEAGGRAGGTGAGAGTVGGAAVDRSMQARLHRLAQLEAELGKTGQGGGKEELDQLLAEWSASRPSTRPSTAESASSRRPEH